MCLRVLGRSSKGPRGALEASWEGPREVPERRWEVPGGQDGVLDGSGGFEEDIWRGPGSHFFSF